MKIAKSTRFWNLAIAGIIIIAFNLFAESPQAWQIKKAMLVNYNPGIGPLNGVVRTNNFLRKLDASGHVLTFGNSQVGSVFAGNRQGKDSIYWTFIPSTPISCYKYFQEDLAKAKPKAVLLYLSDINMSMNPFFIPLKYHNFSIPTFMQDLNTIKNQNIYINKDDAQIIFFSEMVKALKESVFLKAFIDKAFFKSSEKKPIKKNKDKAHSKEKNASIKKDKEQSTSKKKEDKALVVFDKKVKNQDKEIEKLIDKRKYGKYEKNIAHNLKELENFCQYLSQHGVSTVIVDSQYHIDAYNYEGDDVQTNNFIIKEFCKQFNFVHHIDIEEMTVLSENEFADHIHFTKEGGRKVRKDIAKSLSQINF